MGAAIVWEADSDIEKWKSWHIPFEDVCKSRKRKTSRKTAEVQKKIHVVRPDTEDSKRDTTRDSMSCGGKRKTTGRLLGIFPKF